MSLLGGSAHAAGTGVGPWVAYAAALWAFVFAVFHIIWAAGWYPLLDAEQARIAFAVPWKWAYDVVAAAMCVIAVPVALAPVTSWGQHLPRRLIYTLAWIGTALLVLRSVASLIQGGYLLVMGRFSFVEMGIWEPWFYLGAILFALSTRRSRHTRVPMPRTRAILLVLLTAITSPLAAQEGRPADVASIDGIIRAYYEVVSGPAGEAADVARDRSLHHPNAWVAIAGVDSTGKPTVRVTTLQGYHGANRPRREGFWEWETARVVSRSGNMVHVWSSYASARTRGGEPYGRGVNTITLFHDGSRWWIMGWMFDSAAP